MKMKAEVEVRCQVMSKHYELLVLFYMGNKKYFNQMNLVRLHISGLRHPTSVFSVALLIPNV